LNNFIKKRRDFIYGLNLQKIPDSIFIPIEFINDLFNGYMKYRYDKTSDYDDDVESVLTMIFIMGLKCKAAELDSLAFKYFSYAFAHINEEHPNIDYNIVDDIKINYTVVLDMKKFVDEYPKSNSKEPDNNTNTKSLSEQGKEEEDQDDFQLYLEEQKKKKQKTEK